MHGRQRFLASMFLAAALALPVLNTACAEHHYYRAYDVEHNDYHVWDAQESVYYNQWAVETHRENRDFRKLNRDEQREYFNWRHSHHDHDHDHDHDRDHNHEKLSAGAP